VSMTDQEKIEKVKSRTSTALPAIVDCWNAKTIPPPFAAAKKAPFGKSVAGMRNRLVSASRWFVKTKLVKTLSLLAAALLLLVRPAAARENPYALLGRCLAPFVNLVAVETKNPNRALSLSVRLEQMTGLPEELRGAHADFAVQAPDKLRVHAPVQGEELTICRKGQEVWVFPGSKAGEVLKKLEAAKKLPPANPKFRLAPFGLPIPEKQLVFIPALFQVHDAGTEAIDGVACQVLDLQLNSMLAHSLKAEDWTARLWVRPDATPARLFLQQGSAWSATVKFETVTFQPALPTATWDPLPEQIGDVAKIPPIRYNQLLRTFFGGK
jgi:hypothetical protein